MAVEKSNQKLYITITTKPIAIAVKEKLPGIEATVIPTDYPKLKKILAEAEKVLLK